MFNFRAMVGVLAKHEVEFAIVGGLAGVMQGAPIHTQDLDILYSLEPPNPTRLLAALKELDATFWDDPRLLRPGISHMESREHKLLGTRFGRIDCLATIEEQTAFEDVLEDLDWMELDGTPVRVLVFAPSHRGQEEAVSPKGPVGTAATPSHARRTTNEVGGVIPEPGQPASPNGETDLSPRPQLAQINLDVGQRAQRSTKTAEAGTTHLAHQAALAPRAPPLGLEPKAELLERSEGLRPSSAHHDRTTWPAAGT